MSKGNAEWRTARHKKNKADKQDQEPRGAGLIAGSDMRKREIPHVEKLCNIRNCETAMARDAVEEATTPLPFDMFKSSKFYRCPSAHQEFNGMLTAAEFHRRSTRTQQKYVRDDDGVEGARGKRWISKSKYGHISLTEQERIHENKLR